MSTLKFVKVSEIGRWKPPQHGQRWGNWEFDKRRLVLTIGRRKWFEYEVDLETCTSGSEILDWILQVAGKGWVTPEDIGYLVEALGDIGGPMLQGNVCPGGQNKEFNMTQHIKSGN